MFLYHQASTEAGKDALENGLQLTAKREMGNREDIKRADAFLDARRPAELIAAGVRRRDNIYAFVGDEATLVDITDGKTVPLETYKQPGCILFRLEADPSVCYAADLDLYDAVKDALSEGKTPTELASDYWRRVIPLGSYRPGSVRRPEVMIVRPITASRLRVV